MAENWSVERFFVFGIFLEGPTLDPLAAAQSKHTDPFPVCSRKSFYFCINSGNISGPRGFQFCLELDPKIDVKTHPPPNHQF